MSQPISEHPFDMESFSATVMAELFDAIGFEVTDEDGYNLLAEHVELSGERSQSHRRDVTLQGRCWKLGQGLEVWSILYERDGDSYYADCRPAFRSRYVHMIRDWELIEYDEDGEAILRGSTPAGLDLVLELQNLTELRSGLFRETRLRVALAGLAYRATSEPSQKRIKKSETPAYRFELAEQIPDYTNEACENDYMISGRVLAWREIENPFTASSLIWTYVDTGMMRLEILMNRRALKGQIEIGSLLSANIWLQGHVLEAAEISARYEGVDHDYETSDFWSGLRRDN